MSRLATHLPPGTQVPPLRLGNIADQEVTITDAKIQTGNYGDYAVMTVVDENGEIVKVITGAELPMDALRSVIETDSFPVQACFTLRGRMWFIE